jgi:glucose dehydrogenase
VTLWVALVFTQRVLAGQFLDGNDDLVWAHGMNAAFVLLTALMLLLAAILLWRPGRGAAWPIGASTLILVLTLVQAVPEVPASWQYTCRSECCCSGWQW